MPGEMSRPAARVLSLGAGVQSTAVLLLAVEGRIPTFDVAVFADTGWEASATYEHLDRLTRRAEMAGIRVRRVSAGNIRSDALDPTHRFASMPLFTLGRNGERGMARRQCTAEYKLRPIKAEVRRLLGYPHPARVPAGVFAEAAIGISVDEIGRARDSDVRYMRHVFPLLHLGWTRADCRAYLSERGFGDTPRSACLGCPFHGDRQWRALRDHDPDGWADVVAFDRDIRHGHPAATAAGKPLRGAYYLHHSRRPLDEAELNARSRPSGCVAEDGDPDGCSPFSCRSGQPIGAPANHTNKHLGRAA